MASQPMFFKRAPMLHDRWLSGNPTPGVVVSSFAGALALSGLAELVLQRVVYRVGVHIPREGAFLEAYKLATYTGDFAFRLTAVLLALTATIAVVWLVERRVTAMSGLALAGVLGANVLIWPFGAGINAGVVALMVAVAAAWVGAAAWAGRRDVAMVATSAGLALILAQLRTGLTALGEEAASVSRLQAGSEIAVMAAAGLAAYAAYRSSPRMRPALGAAALTVVLVAAYAREPSTLAIVSLWATGITVSLPPLAYLAAFALFAFAVLAWLQRPSTTHLAVGLVLLLVAGLQPQALHHGVTALLGLILLSAGPFVSAGISKAEVLDGI